MWTVCLPYTCVTRSTGRAPVRWFDCDVSTSIVLLFLAHVYRWADGPVLP